MKLCVTGLKRKLEFIFDFPKRSSRQVFEAYLDDDTLMTVYQSKKLINHVEIWLFHNVLGDMSCF